MSAVLERIVDDVRERYEYAKEHITREMIFWQISFALIVIIAFIVRILPFFNFEIAFRGTDPFIQLKSAELILNKGLGAFLSWWDATAWYPTGYPRGARLYVGTPIAAILIYYAAHLIGIPLTIEEAAYFEPAVFGTLSVIAIYLLGKELGNEKVGLLAAFFLSMSPGHLQRSTVGFFDNEALGIFCLILTLYFFARSLNRDSLVDGFLAGISLGVLANTWSAYLYVLDLLTLYVFILILVKKYSDRLLKTYGLTYTTFLLIAILTPRNLYAGSLFSVGVLGPAVVLLVLVLFELYDVYGSYIAPEHQTLLFKGVISLSALTIVASSFYVIINPQAANLASKFFTTIFPFFRDQTPILKSVAEHQTVGWGTLYSEVSVLLFFIPIGIYYTYRKPTEMNILATVFLLTALYFVGSMVRLILIFAPAISLYAAKAMVETLVPYVLIFHKKYLLTKRRRPLSALIGSEQVTLAISIIGVLILAVTINSFQAIQDNAKTPQSFLTPVIDDQGNFGAGNDWQQATKWIKEHMSETRDVGLFWWDYGYWIHVNSNATILVDNATGNRTQIGNVGAALLSTPDVSLKIMKRYHVSYVVVVPGLKGVDNDFAKAVWMLRIANKSNSLVKINLDDYAEFDSSGKSLKKFLDKFYESTLWALLTVGLTPDNIDSLTQRYSFLQKNITAGFAKDYRDYQNVFEEAFYSSNKIVRIFKVNYDNAPTTLTWELGEIALNTQK